MKYSEILKLNQQNINKKNHDEYKIFFLSNIIVNTIQSNHKILEFDYLDSISPK